MSRGGNQNECIEDYGFGNRDLEFKSVVARYQYVTNRDSDATPGVGPECP